jgi:hypothetical protein
MFDNWPVFPLKLNCPGGIDQSGKQFFCHESYDRTFIAKHGDLRIEVTVCGHVWDSNGCSSFKEEVSDFLGEYYDSVTNVTSSHVSRMVAFKRGFSWTYLWNYSTHAKCGQCGWLAQNDTESESMRRFSGFFPDLSASVAPWIYRQTKESGEIFCSAKCASAFVHANCPVCGVGNELTVSDKFRHYRERLFDRFDIWMASANHCSRQCCSLAVHDYLKSEREERKRKVNLKCVQEVKRVLSKTKKALQNQDSQEVLQSLKREFAQAANLP